MGAREPWKQQDEVKRETERNFSDYRNPIQIIELYSCPNGSKKRVSDNAEIAGLA
jgi:hypothetical protein